jgi:hypothetical protein
MEDLCLHLLWSSLPYSWRGVLHDPPLAHRRVVTV